MIDRLEAMAILDLVVEKGSLSSAARHLHMPLPTLSRKLADLERQLGTRLLIRTTRRLALTDAGSVYLSAARRILADVEAAPAPSHGRVRRAEG